MVVVRRSAIIDAPLDAVWAILRDFNGHDRWHPAVATSRIEDGAPADLVGAVRDFRLEDGSRIREQLLALSDRETSFIYCMLEAPLPLIDYVAHVRLRAVTDAGATFWEWRSRFEPPPSQRDRLVRLVAEEIYEAGFQAIRSLLGPGNASVPRAAASVSVTSRSGIVEAPAVVVARHGGPEVLEYRAVRVPAPGPGEVRIEQRAIGVNFIDVYSRTGYLDLLRPPAVPGMEAAGFIESVGPGVTAWRPGDRVGYACAPPGAYAGMRVMDPALLVRLPDWLSCELAAASLLKGITASFLLHDVARVERGWTVLVHAAAGGVGGLLCQWATALGAKVIGTVSTEAKADRARSAGCAEVIRYDRDDLATAVSRATGGRGVHVVYDAVGQATFDASVRCLAPRGHLVSFGQASGDIGSYEIGKLASRSITLSRPSYGHYTDTPEAIKVHTARLFAALERKSIHLDQPSTYRLADAASAHTELEGRRTHGALILIP